MSLDAAGGSRSLKSFNGLITATLVCLAVSVAAWVAAWLLGLDILYAVAGAFAFATAIPLFLFAYAARALPYSTVGVLQYIAPSLQLMCGVLLFHERFGPGLALGFGLIWIALLVYAADGLWRARTPAAAAAA